MTKPHDSLYLYIGMATGALTNPGALEHLTLALQMRTLNRSYIEYLRDKLSQALKDSPPAADWQRDHPKETQ